MTSSIPPSPNRGEIWTVRFDPSIGAEIQKIRPAAVVNVPEYGRLPLRIVVPLTDWKPEYAALPWFVPVFSSPLNSLAKDSGADAFQVKSVACGRFLMRLGRLTDAELESIIAAVILCIGLPNDQDKTGSG
jgi:mRNA interferase MazF